MKHEFLIVKGDDDARKPHQRDYEITAVANSKREARERAESCAQSNPGTPFTIYEKGPTFTGKVKVDTDEPQAPEDRG
jgi:hypothetical protein